jgi:hypothetical protein
MGSIVGEHHHSHQNDDLIGQTQEVVIEGPGLSGGRNQRQYPVNSRIV